MENHFQNGRAKAEAEIGMRVGNTDPWAGAKKYPGNKYPSPSKLNDDQLYYLIKDLVEDQRDNQANNTQLITGAKAEAKSRGLNY